MPGLLNETELAILHDEWVEHRFVDPISVVSKAHQDIHSLLDHIEAQEETLQEYRETLASQYAAIVEDNDLHQQLETAQVEVAVLRLAPTTADATAGQVPLDALAALELVSSEWKVLTEIDYLRADVQHLQDVAGAAEHLYLAFHRLPMTHWKASVTFWLSCLHDALKVAGYLREKDDAE